MTETSDSSFDGTDGSSLTSALHNEAESGGARSLERLLGLSDESATLGALFRRLVNSVDRNGCTPLHLAIINGHPACVSVLLRGGASADKPCDGSPPLALAACLALSASEERAAAADACVDAMLQAGADPHDRDDGGRTPLHWAACAGRQKLVALLLDAAAAVQREQLATAVEAEMAAASGGSGSVAGGLSSVGRPEHILMYPDQDGHTALHLAAKFGHGEVATQLYLAASESGDEAATTAAALAKAAAEAAEAAKAAAAESAAAAAAAGSAVAAAAAESSAAAAAAPPPPDGTEGASAPAPAAEPPTAAALASLLPVCDPVALARIRTKLEGHTAIHLAALHGRAEAIHKLLEAVAAVAGRKDADAKPLVTTLLAVGDRRSRPAADLARRRGHTALATALADAEAGSPFVPPPPPSAADSTSDPSFRRTLLLAPEECLLHRTAPEPFVRGGSEPPPENVKRLHVLTRPVSGILHNSEFADLEWRTTGVPQAAMVDVLKCHDWSYVRGVIQACDAIPDSPSAVGSLDPDTAISRHTMKAALVAAGAVCAAVDDVVTSKARNAFCAVRPPGHHAGPTGMVTNPNDAHGSHGFCLLSNVAIGAAYAMSVHRHAGIRRVAIVDFDVHHGNGTQACVINTAPSVRTVSIRTPFSEGQQRFPVYKPWMGDGDLHNIFFASVQGYGRRGAIGGWFYPGSGATADSTVAESLNPATAAAAAASGGASADKAQAATTAAAAAATTPGGINTPAGDAGPGGSSRGGSDGSGGEIPEDPDGEFRGSYDVTVVGGPRVINVGIPGPGGKPRMWRRAWRDKILPALMNFRPDIILVSAGFDAHKKEDLNLRYVGVTEYDYEWLTGQIVEVANTCCAGRVVSVLEGGYNLRGGPLGSAFARSVAAHVRALAAPCAAPYNPADAEAERLVEKALEVRKLAKSMAQAAGIVAAGQGTPRSAAPTPRGQPPTTPSAAAAAAAAGAAAAAAAAATATTAAGDGPAPMDTDRPAAEVAPAAADGAAGGRAAADEPPSKRRRRPVDYAALNAELEKERQEAAAKASGGADAQA